LTPWHKRGRCFLIRGHAEGDEGSCVSANAFEDQEIACFIAQDMYNANHSYYRLTLYRQQACTLVNYGPTNVTRICLNQYPGKEVRGLALSVEPNTFKYPLPLGFSYASGLSASQPFPGKPANLFIPRDRRSANMDRWSPIVSMAEVACPWS
jgi:hypothetical protein